MESWQNLCFRVTHNDSTANDITSNLKLDSVNELRVNNECNNSYSHGKPWYFDKNLWNYATLYDDA